MRGFIDKFIRFHLDDVKDQQKTGLSSRFTPKAIRQTDAVFSAKWHKGELRNKGAERYLIKLIISQQGLLMKLTLPVKNSGKLIIVQPVNIRE